MPTKRSRSAATSTPASSCGPRARPRPTPSIPGYGFLAENGDFAEAVAGAGIVFVGPPPAALRASGDKLEAKRIAREAGVPVVESGEPGELGFPLIVKAAAGGGGRGMRVVHSPEQLAEALESAAREAEAGFGDGRVFAERFVERPRHVEIQLLADRHGNVVHLGERECSIQRRHQKVLEESPSPALDPELRARDGRGRRRLRAGGRLRERRHRRVHARRRRLLLPGAERAAAGGASGDGARDRARPRRAAAPDRGRRAARPGVARARRPRRRGAALRRAPADLPAAGRPPRAARAAGDACASMRASRQGTRSRSPTTR